MDIESDHAGGVQVGNDVEVVGAGERGEGKFQFQVVRLELKEPLVSGGRPGLARRFGPWRAGGVRCHGAGRRLGPGLKE